MRGGNVKFEIKGLREVNQMLSQLPKAVNDKVLYDLNRSGGNIVKKAIEEAVPDSNTDKASKDKIAANVVVKKNPDDKTGVLIGFLKKVWYVKLMEMGTKVRNTLGKGKYKKKANRGTITRKPFVEQAHAEAYPKVIEHFTTNYLKIVNKSIKRQLNKLKRSR